MSERKAMRWHTGRRASATRVLAVASVVASFTLAACGSSSPSGSAPAASSGQVSSSGDYVLGADLPLTGGVQAASVPFRQGLATYFQEVNSAGGIKGHQVKLVTLDDGNSVTTAVANVRELVTTDHVSGVFFFLSDMQAATQTYLVQNKVVTMANAVTSQLLDPTNKYLFAGGISIPGEAVPMVDFALNKLPRPAGAKVAIITTTSVAAQELDQALQQGAKAHGMQVVGNQLIPLTQPDVSSEAEQFAAANPSLILTALNASQMPQFVQTLRQRGFKGPIVTYDGSSVYGMMKQLDDPNLYMMFSVTAGHNPGAEVAKMDAAAKAAGIAPGAYFFPQGYVQAWAIGQGLAKCGYPCDGPQLANALESLGSINTGGLTAGAWLDSPTDHAGIQDVAFYSWDPATDNEQQDGPSYPMPKS
jgi:ABC-type branched-subunit amino acid transport system substrate-binding protein